jgi:hypothetical protein
LIVTHYGQELVQNAIVGRCRWLSQNGQACAGPMRKKYGDRCGTLGKKRGDCPAHYTSTTSCVLDLMGNMTLLIVSKKRTISLHLILLELGEFLK